MPTLHIGSCTFKLIYLWWNPDRWFQWKLAPNIDDYWWFPFHCSFLPFTDSHSLHWLCAVPLSLRTQHHPLHFYQSLIISFFFLLGYLEKEVVRSWKRYTLKLCDWTKSPCRRLFLPHNCETVDTLTQTRSLYTYVKEEMVEEKSRSFGTEIERSKLLVSG